MQKEWSCNELDSRKQSSEQNLNSRALLHMPGDKKKYANKRRQCTAQRKRTSSERNKRIWVWMHFKIAIDEKENKVSRRKAAEIKGA